VGSGRNHTLLTATLNPAVRTVTYSNGENWPVIGWSTRVLTKLDNDDTN
jgi:hypothetical protein